MNLRDPFTSRSEEKDFPSPGPAEAPRYFSCGRAEGFAGNYSWC